MEYVLDPSLNMGTDPTMGMGTDPTMGMDTEQQVYEMPQMPQIAQQEPQVIKTQDFKLVLPFASFDRSTPTKFAGSILNWTALLACILWVFLMGKHGFTSGKTIVAFMVCVIFTIATTIILSSSGYRRR
jgi:hypothetical protein